MIPEEYKFLFIKANIKFFTKEDYRLPTFYFESSQGFKGRVRQQHNDDPKISYQGKKCIRRFIKKENLRKLSITMNLARDNKIDFAFRNELFGRLSTDVATEGWHVLEYHPENTICHVSGGVVGTNQTEINNFDLNAFIAENKYKFSADWGD